MGRVMNKKSVDAWAAEANAAATTAYNTAKEAYTTAYATWEALSDEDKATTPKPEAPQAPQDIDLSIGSGYTDNGLNDPLATGNSQKRQEIQHQRHHQPRR